MSPCPSFNKFYVSDLCFYAWLKTCFSWTGEKKNEGRRKGRSSDRVGWTYESHHWNGHLQNSFLVFWICTNVYNKIAPPGLAARKYGSRNVTYWNDKIHNKRHTPNKRTHNCPVVWNMTRILLLSPSVSVWHVSAWECVFHLVRYCCCWGDRGVCLLACVHAGWRQSEQKLAKLKNRSSRKESDAGKMGNRSNRHTQMNTHTLLW